MGKTLINLQGLPYLPQNLAKFGPETAENDRRVFVHPLYFHIGRHCQLYCMNVIYNRQQANFGTCYVVGRAYCLEQQNAGRAQTGL